MTIICPQCQGPHALDDCPRWRQQGAQPIAWTCVEAGAPGKWRAAYGESPALNTEQVIEFGSTLIGHASETDGMDTAEGRAWVRAKLSEWAPSAAPAPPDAPNQGIRLPPGEYTINYGLGTEPQHFVVPESATPPAAPALTDADIRKIWNDHFVPVFGTNGISPIVFARAIERHLAALHGESDKTAGE